MDGRPRAPHGADQQASQELHGSGRQREVTDSAFDGDQPMAERVSTMANPISPLAELFRDMADLIDQDHTSQTHYEAITRAAAVAAADATRQDLAAGRLWEADGAGLLAAAYAFPACRGRREQPLTSERCGSPARCRVPQQARAPRP